MFEGEQSPIIPSAQIVSVLEDTSSLLALRLSGLPLLGVSTVSSGVFTYMYIYIIYIYIYIAYTCVQGMIREEYSNIACQMDPFQFWGNFLLY